MQRSGQEKVTFAERQIGKVTMMFETVVDDEIIQDEERSEKDSRPGKS